MDTITANFLEFLTQKGVSSTSLKHYKSDLSHFSGWILLKVRSWGAYANDLPEAIPYLSSSVAKEYKRYLENNQKSAQTINRKLSTLRSFAGYLQSSKLLNLNFAEEITNITTHTLPQEKGSYIALIKDFGAHLANEKISHTTTKNYLSDIRHFLSWLEDKNHAHTS